MSTFPSHYLAQVHYNEIIESIKYLSIHGNSPRNDLENGLYIAMSSIETSVKPIGESKRSAFSPIMKMSNEKTKVCKNYSTGDCRFGDECTFLHVKGNVTRFENKVGSEFGNTSTYKKKPCKNFRIGVCKYGQRCTFLHEMCANPECTDEPQESCLLGHSASAFKKKSEDDDNN
jgi:hypothetical protein